MGLMDALLTKLLCWTTNSGTVIPPLSSRLVHGREFTCVVFAIVVLYPIPCHLSKSHHFVQTSLSWTFDVGNKE